MKIEIWSDIACPFCYIGKKRFEKALDQFPFKDEVEVEYKSFILNPNAPKETKLSGVEELARVKSISIDKAKQIYQQVAAMAKTEGLDYNLDNMKATSTNDAHRLIQWVKTLGKDQKLIEKLFEGYFINGLNIADKNTLLDIVDQLGIDTEKALAILESNEFKSKVDNDINEARILGVNSVPTFVINREYGISGAQSVEAFSNVLNEMYDKMNPNKIKISKDDSACGPEGCEI